MVRLIKGINIIDRRVMIIMSIYEQNIKQLKCKNIIKISIKHIYIFIFD